MRKIFLLFVLLFFGIVVFQFFPQKKLPTNRPVTKIVVHKKQRRLQVYSDKILLKTYKIALGFTPSGAKHFEGDGKTPEGLYSIDSKNPKSVCYLNLGVSYPSDSDRKYAAKYGKKTGGDIKIHGIHPSIAWIGRFHYFRDWSNGCICVTNPEIKELYDHVPIGTPIEILP